MDELERQVQQVRIVTPNETCGANTALARPILDVECGCCGSNFFVEASVLYWHPRVSGTEFTSGSLVISTILGPDGESDAGSVKNCLKSIDLCWNWGFEIGVGYNLPCDGWDILLNYTGFNSKGHKSVCAGKDNEYLINYKAFPLTELTGLLQERSAILFKVGFDARYFWRMNQILQARDSTLQYERISEDLSIDGVTFDIRIDF